MFITFAKYGTTALKAGTGALKCLTGILSALVTLIFFVFFIMSKERRGLRLAVGVSEGLDARVRRGAGRCVH